MCEKYDGVRICWTPVSRKLYVICSVFVLCSLYIARYTKNGNEVDVSMKLLSFLPKRDFIDGELWYIICHPLI